MALLDIYADRGRTGGGKVGMTMYCPKCGELCEMFYNAGIPVWGCKKCRDKQVLIWSDRTGPTDEQREATPWNL